MGFLGGQWLPQSNVKACFVGVFLSHITPVVSPHFDQAIFLSVGCLHLSQFVHHRVFTGMLVHFNNTNSKNSFLNLDIVFAKTIKETRKPLQLLIEFTASQLHVCITL